MTTGLYTALSDELLQAMQQRETVPLISARHPEFGIEDAYKISLDVVGKRLQAGERLIGKKIGLTTEAVQKMIGIDEPDFGFLTDAMQFIEANPIPVAEYLIAPRIEAEIAVVLRTDLPTEAVTPAQVLDAIDYALPCLEVVDSRFNTPKIGLVDTIADNASAGLFILGDNRFDPRQQDLAGVRCEVLRNGRKISEGSGSAVLGSPLNSIAWLANRLGSYDMSLNAGDIILAGSLVPLADIAAGDQFEARFDGIGTVSANFS